MLGFVVLVVYVLCHSGGPSVVVTWYCLAGHRSEFDTRVLKCKPAIQADCSGHGACLPQRQAQAELHPNQRRASQAQVGPAGAETAAESRGSGHIAPSHSTLQPVATSRVFGQFLLFIKGADEN